MDLAPLPPEPAPAESLDRLAHAWSSRVTGGISPASLALAWTDWASHLLMNPAKLHELFFVKTARKQMRLAEYASRAWMPGCEPCIEPLAQDHRFSAAAWQQWPYNVMHQAFLLTQQWWYNATTEVRGVSRHHEEVVTFIARQMLDVVSPSNCFATNPELLSATLAQGGANLVRGAMNWGADWQRLMRGQGPDGSEAFEVGRNLALTPGKVVLRNRLMELIQYSPSTATVHPEPVLIVPAWIMKYYILDLQPHNSLIKYLVDQGHTVFAISWKNPRQEDRDLGMDDYLRLGLFAAVQAATAITAITASPRVHAVGYCLGGTLLAIGAAVMARDGDERLAGVSLFAAQTEFSEPGELALFIDESQVAYLEDIMWDRGYLTKEQMAGAFQMLRSWDLFWSRNLREYLLGERMPMVDLMAWNADATRLPYRMHTEYLRSLFLHDDLAEGRYRVGGKPVVLGDVRVPFFAVGTETDHVAPWRSVFKIHLLTDAEVTFLLTSGGHNAGIVSPPGHDRRHYRVATRADGGRYVDPDSYLATTLRNEGSWWPRWQQWLASHSGTRAAPPAMGRPEAGYDIVADAPGSYVHMR